MFYSFNNKLGQRVKPGRFGQRWITLGTLAFGSLVLRAPVALRFEAGEGVTYFTLRLRERVLFAPVKVGRELFLQLCRGIASEADRFGIAVRRAEAIGICVSALYILLGELRNESACIRPTVCIVPVCRRGSADDHHS